MIHLLFCLIIESVLKLIILRLASFNCKLIDRRVQEKASYTKGSGKQVIQCLTELCLLLSVLSEIWMWKQLHVTVHNLRRYLDMLMYFLQGVLLPGIET